ncbi:hypothetical protein WICPIJ_003737 [Wickerhamomyces pijperi]|uniref:Uncharacterized protein n=1 Tax=Wickerhamomyces pijperi TaxID=599730 RepID=A0A9P8TMQ3_WICPI|nr:hypothetical protein WICPIJ_003737 [Wickerhamomyces pijperi]
MTPNLPLFLNPNHPKFRLETSDINKPSSQSRLIQRYTINCQAAAYDSQRFVQSTVRVGDRSQSKPKRIQNSSILNVFQGSLFFNAEPSSKLSLFTVTKDFRHFFQSPTRSFRIEEVNHNQFTKENAIVDDVVLPFDSIHGNRIDEPIVDQNSHHRKLEDVDTFGSVGIWQDLSDVKEW